MIDSTLRWIGFGVVASLGLCLIGLLADFWWKRLSSAFRIAVVILARGTAVGRLRDRIRLHDDSCGSVQRDMREQLDRAWTYACLWKAQLQDNGFFAEHPPEGMSREDAHALEQRSVGRFRRHESEPEGTRHTEPDCLCEDCVYRRRAMAGEFDG